MIVNIIKSQKTFGIILYYLSRITLDIFKYNSWSPGGKQFVRFCQQFMLVNYVEFIKFFKYLYLILIHT